MSGPASMWVWYDHNKALHVRTIMINKFYRGSVRRNVTYLVLADSHSTQKDGPRTTFPIYYTCGHHLELASLSNHLKWGFNILKTNREEDGSLMNDN